MPETVTLTIPDEMHQSIQRVAQATHSPIEDLLVTALETSLPPLEGLPAGIADDLAALEDLDDEALCDVMAETVPAEEQGQILDFLDRGQSRELTEEERARLASLQQSADLVMLRKARAAVLLRFRGKRIPTLVAQKLDAASAQNGLMENCRSRDRKTSGPIRP
jgi:primosomal protein N'